MTNFAQARGDDYPAAAEKHLSDADALLKANRFDGAAYLTGYVLECSLRSVIMAGEILTRGRVPRGEEASAMAQTSYTMRQYGKAAAGEARKAGGDHDLDRLADAMRSLEAVFSSANAMYAPKVDKTKPPWGGAWSHNMRYRAGGKVSEKDANEWFAEAKDLYSSTVGAMLRDGVVCK